MNLGIDVGTKNRPQSIIDLLSSLAESKDIPHGDIEILLTDDSVDGLPKSLDAGFNYHKLVYPMRLTVIPGSKQSPAYVHENALEYFNENGTDYVLKIDDDIVVNNDFLSKLMELIESDNNILAVGGLYIQHGSENAKCNGFGYHCQFWYNQSPSPFEVPYLHSSWIYRTEAMKEAGGFEPHLFSKVAHREETLASLRLRKSGNGKLMVHPGAIAHHRRNPVGGIRCDPSEYVQLCFMDDLVFYRRCMELEIDVKDWINSEGNTGRMYL